MLRNDTGIAGFIMGLIFPAIFFFILREVNGLFIEYYFQGGEGFSLKFISILAVSSNLIPFVIYKRTRKDHAMQGVIWATLILAAIVIIYFWKEFMTLG